MIANLITLSGVAAATLGGWLAIAAQPNWQLVVGLLLVAAAADFADGKIARLLGTAPSDSAGKSLDEAADFYNFALVGGGVLWLWSLQPFAPVATITATETMAVTGAVAALIVCCGWRLFVRRRAMVVYFVGMPAPLACCWAMLPLFLWLADGGEGWRSPLTVAGFTLTAAVLMVSKQKFWAMRTLPEGYFRSLAIGILIATATIGAAVSFWAGTTFATLAVTFYCVVPGERFHSI